MKQFIYGFLSAMFFSGFSAWFYLVDIGVPSTLKVKQLSVETEKNTKVEPAVKSPAKSICPTLAKAIKKNNNKQLETLPFKAVPTEELSTIESRVVKKLTELSQNDLLRVEHILAQLNAKTPKELFSEETVDYEWSQQKQIELEYDYYDKSRLKDIGDLQSIDCKSHYCRVKVRVSSTEHFSPSWTMDWARTSSVSVAADQQDNAYKMIEIYVVREQELKTGN